VVSLFLIRDSPAYHPQNAIKKMAMVSWKRHDLSGGSFKLAHVDLTEERRKTICSGHAFYLQVSP
jgi:hypothetical protein